MGYQETPWDIDPDKLLKSLTGKFRKKFFGKTWTIVVIVLAVIALMGSFYTVDADQVGIVLRFGKYVRTTEPGLHLKIPFGIEQAIGVKVEKNYQEEFGFRTQSAGGKTVYSTRPYDTESLMLTGDLNVMDVEWIVQYKKKDPYKTLFNVRDIIKTLRDVSESVMREVVGDYTFNEVLAKRLIIGDTVRERMQTIMDKYGVGLQIITVKLQDVNPPDAVRPAFNEVNQAKQEKKRMKNEADEVYFKVIPEARGTAVKMVQEAEGYAAQRVNQAKGDAARFDLTVAAYSKSKDVTRRRIYLERMKDVLQGVGKKYIVDPEQEGILPLLRLENEK